MVSTVNSVYSIMKTRRVSVLKDQSMKLFLLRLKKKKIPQNYIVHLQFYQSYVSGTYLENMFITVLIYFIYSCIDLFQTNKNTVKQELVPITHLNEPTLTNSARSQPNT